MVTFKQFRKVMSGRHTPQALASRFRRKIDNQADFFSRVWQERYDDVVIPYRSVLEFYGLQCKVSDKQKRPRQPMENTGLFGGVFSPPLSTPQPEVKHA